MCLFVCWVVLQWVFGEVFDEGVCDKLNCVCPTNIELLGWRLLDIGGIRS